MKRESKQTPTHSQRALTGTLASAYSQLISTNNYKNRKMKKILLLMISLFMSHLVSFGQTNGTGTNCSNSILLEHNGGAYTINQSETWIQFTATSSYISITSDSFTEEIELYNGECDSLYLLSLSTDSLIFDSLYYGFNYFIRINTNNTPSNVVLNSIKSTNETFCILSQEPCNKITNGDFNNYTFDINDGGGGAYSNGDITGWYSLNSTPDLVQVSNGNTWSQMWASSYEHIDAPDGLWDYGESIGTCTDLLPDVTYLFFTEYKTHVNSNPNFELDFYVNIGESDIIDQTINAQLEASHNLYVSSTQNIFTHLDLVPNSTNTMNNAIQIFKPTVFSDRLIIWSKSNIQVPNAQTLYVDNVTVIPIEYEDVHTCLEAIQIFPTCNTVLNDILSLPNTVEFDWAPSSAILSGGDTHSPVINPSIASQLTLTITQNNVSESIIVNVDYTPLDVDISMGDLLCYGDNNGFINLNINNGTPPYSFEWSNGEITSSINNLEAGTYTVTITDFEGCIKEETININQPDEIVVYSNISLEGCMPGHDGAIDLTISGGVPDYVFNWSSPTFSSFSAQTEDISNLESGFYNCDITDANNCPAIVKLFVGQSTIEAIAEAIDTWEGEACGSVFFSDIVGSGDYVYNWADATGAIISTDASVSGLEEGVYSYTVTDNVTGCSDDGLVTVGLANQGSLNDITRILCEGSSTILGQNLPGTYDSYNWSTGETSPTIIVSEYGEYTLNVFFDNGCRAQVTYLVYSYAANIKVRDSHNDCSLHGIEEKQGYTLTSTFFSPWVSYHWQLTTYEVNGNIVNQDSVYADDEETTAQLDATAGEHYGIVTLTITTPQGCDIVRTVTIYNYNHIFSSDYHVNGQETWESRNYIFEKNLIIDGTASLNVKNCHLEFAPGYGIVVSDAKTKMKVDNSSLSNLYCEDLLWNGVLIKGVPDNNHNYNEQPSVFFTNNSIVEHAKYGAKSVLGAILYSEGQTKFVNNEYGVVFEGYNKPNNDVSFLVNTIFETNAEGQIISDLNPTRMVEIRKFQQLKLKQNTFRNTNYNCPINERGIGLYAEQMKSIDISYGNHFERLKQGLIANNINSLMLEYNTFERNYRGAYLNSVKFAVAIYNSFNDEMLTPTNHAFQMGLIGCTRPIIGNNSFKNGVTGLYLGKANFEDFQIYGNTFEGFDIHGNQLSANSGLNGYPSCFINASNSGTFQTPWEPAEGAELKCNTFTDYDYAIAITSGQIKGVQGSDGNLPDAPAGNQFFDDNDNDNMPDGRFFVKSTANQSQYKYYHHTNQPTFVQPFNSPTVTPDGSSIVPFVDDPLAGSCPDQIPALALSISEIKLLVDELKLEISTKKDELFSKVDNGNTDLLLSDIQTLRPNNYFDLIEQISSLGGYISDEALLAFMQNGINRHLAKTIALVANSPLPESVKDEIAKLDMPQHFIEIVQSSQEGINAREADEMEILRLEQDLAYLLRVSEYKANKEPYSDKYNEVVDLLLEQDDWDTKEKAYQMLLSSPRESEAQAVFLQLEDNLVNFEEDKQEHMQDYLDMLILETEIDSCCDSLRVERINSHQSVLGRLLSSQYKKGKVRAELLLEEAGLDEKEPLLIQLPNPEQSDNRSATSSEQNKSKVYKFTDEFNLIEVYPNPVDNILTVEYLMLNGMQANSIGIYDINGKLLMTQNIIKAMDILNINVSKLSTGTYIIAFGKDGANSSSTKFIVK